MRFKKNLSTAIVGVTTRQQAWATITNTDISIFMRVLRHMIDRSDL